MYHLQNVQFIAFVWLVFMYCTLRSTSSSVIYVGVQIAVCHSAGGKLQCVSMQAEETKA